ASAGARCRRACDRVRRRRDRGARAPLRGGTSRARGRRGVARRRDPRAARRAGRARRGTGWGAARSGRAHVGRRRTCTPRPVSGNPVIFRRRFADVIRRQLDLFEREHRGLVEDCIAAERAYNRSDRDEAEERYGDYVDLVETGTEVLADLRDTFATTLEEDVAEEYERAFNQAVLRRFRRFALEIEDR